MTREEILINSIWTDGKMYVYSNFFEDEVQITLLTSSYVLAKTDKIISKKFVDAVNDFLNLSKDNLPLMKKLLYKHCIKCCEDIGYGFDVMEGETEKQANLREFGVHDEESAFKNSYLDHILIDEDDQEINRFVRVVFYPEWDSHGCELIIKNGKLLDFYGESDTYLGQFK